MQRILQNVEWALILGALAVVWGARVSQAETSNGQSSFTAEANAGAKATKATAKAAAKDRPAVNPAAKASSDNQIPPALEQRLDEMSRRIEELEAELKAEREERRAAAAPVEGAAFRAPAAPNPESAATKATAGFQTPAANEQPETSVASNDLAKKGATPGAAAIASAASISQASGSAAPEQSAGIGDFVKGMTFNGTLDGYYEYNFNSPVGRVNLLRAYDVSSNSFSLNQATFVIERAPDLTEGRRFGVRVDLQYGQATETLQGNAANELRPNVYRPVFQAYGTYIANVGSGLTIDFGKWASALGIENNYTKDQINYSRSFLFNFLPFYHMGARVAYNLTPKINVAYWLVNGAEQTEDFNGFKSQAFLITLKPASSLSWNVNYYFGQEQRDVVQVLNPGFPAGPTQPGLPVTPVVPTPNGREHIFDTYATWNATRKWTFAGEGDYVIDRVFAGSAPAHVTGGAAYARYQWTPKFAIGTRSEYFSDRGGLFSGTTQALKEVTLTAEYKFAEGFLVREEWRRDFSNQPFFLTEAPGVLKKDQNTATVGLVWWFGLKQGGW
ncbi:MAG TPA: outer membrane beta-barrel protein [Candidatus Acidoferrales bacterium]|nr:outer membrane beta-barrel protein [Candidatus Acidoferrales bacterium]